VKIVAVDHIGIAVRSLEEALRFYRDHLQMESGGVEEVSGEKVRVVLLRAGNSRIELLEAISEDSPIARFLARRGPGLHHISLRVENLAEALEGLRAAGVHLITSEPRLGAGGHLYAFIHPDSTSGVLLELVEEEPKGV